MAYGLTYSADFDRNATGASTDGAEISNQYGLTSWQAFTVETWFKLDALPATNGVYALGTIGWATIGFHYWYYNNAGTYQLLGMRHSWLTNTTVVSYDIALDTNRWYHYAFTKDSSHNGILYLDGVQVASGNLGSSTGSTRTQKSTIGMAWNNGNYAHGMDGHLSLHRIWSTVRTQQQIQDNMCNVFGTATTGMRAEHSLDNVWTDASGNSYTLTARNTPTFALDVPTICTPSTSTKNPLFFGSGL